MTLTMTAVTAHAEEEAPSIHEVMLSGPPRHRRRRARTMFDDVAIRRLEAIFQLDQYPDIARRDELAKLLDVSEARIQVIQPIYKDNNCLFHCMLRPLSLLTS